MKSHVVFWFSGHQGQTSLWCLFSSGHIPSSSLRTGLPHYMRRGVQYLLYPPEISANLVKVITHLFPLSTGAASRNPTWEPTLHFIQVCSLVSVCLPTATPRWRQWVQQHHQWAWLQPWGTWLWKASVEGDRERPCIPHGPGMILLLDEELTTWEWSGASGSLEGLFHISATYSAAITQFIQGDSFPIEAFPSAVIQNCKKPKPLHWEKGFFFFFSFSVSLSLSSFPSFPSFLPFFPSFLLNLFPS